MALRLFKYRSCEAAIRDLETGDLWFARPNTLNDTLETRYQSALPADFMRTLVNALNEVGQQRGESPHEVIDFQDPVSTEAIRQEDERLATFCSGIGIYAAARRPDHQAMWAYYGANGTGVCFELEVTTDVANAHQIWASDVVYGSGPRVHNRAEDMAVALRRLADQNPQKSTAELWAMMLEEPVRRRFGIESAARAASRKHTDWQHEDEIRLLVPIAKAVPILRQTLKAVHFQGFVDQRIGEVFSKLVDEYAGVRIVRWVYDDGEMHLAGQEMELRLVPVEEGR